MLEAGRLTVSITIEHSSFSHILIFNSQLSSYIMDIYSVDYLAVSGHSWLHRLPARVKLIALAIIIAVVLAMHLLVVSAAVLAGMLLLAVSARLPLRIVIALICYPLVFIVLLVLSLQHATVWMLVPLVTRVLALTASVILVLLTTSYPAIFNALGHVLPGGFVTALFFTYRSLFIIGGSIANVQTALHLRGGISWRRPITSLKNYGAALAHVLIYAIELSQRVAENLTVRGFQNRIYSLRKQP